MRISRCHRPTNFRGYNGAVSSTYTQNSDPSVLCMSFTLLQNLASCKEMMKSRNVGLSDGVWFLETWFLLSFKGRYS